MKDQDRCSGQTSESFESREEAKKEEKVTKSKRKEARSYRREKEEESHSEFLRSILLAYAHHFFCVSKFLNRSRPMCLSSKKIF